MIRGARAALLRCALGAAPFVAAFAVLHPLLGVAFLADDYHALERIHAHVTAEGSLAAALEGFFTQAWDERFQIFRPFLLLSLAADLAVFGPDSTAFHATNLVLHGAAALAATFAVGRLAGLRARGPRRVLLLFFLVTPASIEAVAWTVGREDLLLLLFSSLALGLHAGGRPCLAALALAGAFCSKETAVVVPFMIGATAVLREGSSLRPGAMIRRLATAWPSAVVLVAYFAVRVAIFGGLGTNYNGRSLWSFIPTTQYGFTFPGRVAHTLMMLAAPLTASAARATSALAALRIAVALPQASLAAVAFLGGTGRRDLRQPALALVLILLGISLLVPIYAVSPHLQQSRALALPSLGAGLLVAGGLRRLRPRTLAAAAAALLATAAYAHDRNRRDYLEASRLGRALTQSLDAALAPTDGRTPPPPALILGHRHAALPGSHVVGNGIHAAARPPFRAVPRRIVPILPEDGMSPLADAVRGAEGRALILLFSDSGTIESAGFLPPPPGEPFRLLLAGGPRIIVDSGAAPVFTILVPGAAPVVPQELTIRFLDAGGPLGLPPYRLGPDVADVRREGDLTVVSWNAARGGSGPAEPPLGPEVLRTQRGRTFAIVATARLDGSVHASEIGFVEIR